MPSRDLADCDSVIRDIFLAAQREFNATRGQEGIVVAVGETSRDLLEQEAYFLKGRRRDPHGALVPIDPVHLTGIVTECDGFVRYSMHNWIGDNGKPASRAIDFRITNRGVYVEGKTDAELDLYRDFGHRCVAKGAVYGGDWPHFKDWDHIEEKIA